MRAKISVAVLIGIVCLSLNWQTIGQGSPRFVLMNNNDNYSYYLDTETVRYIPDPYRDEKLIDAWIKVVPTENGRQVEIRKRQNDKLNTYGYEDFNYSMRRYNFRLNQRQMQRVYLRDFSSNGAVLDTQSDVYDAARWEDIIPDSSGEVWYKAALKRFEKKDSVIEGSGKWIND